MKSTIINPLLTLFVVLFLSSCSKDENPQSISNTSNTKEIEVEYRVTGTSEINPLKVTLLHPTGGKNSTEILINQKEVTSTLPYSYKYKQPLTEALRAFNKKSNLYYIRSFVGVELIVKDSEKPEVREKIAKSRFNIEIYYNGKLAFQETFQPTIYHWSYITPDINYKEE